jgi:signal transduction histidine kinase
MTPDTTETAAGQLPTAARFPAAGSGRRRARLRGRVRPEVVHAAKVALAASLLVGVVYAGCVSVLDWVVSARMTSSVEAKLADKLSDIRNHGMREVASDGDTDATPVYVWIGTSSGPVGQPAAEVPRLPRGLALADRRTTTVSTSRGPFLLTAGLIGKRVVIVGQSLQSQDHLLTLLRAAEVLAAPFLLLAMFAGALIIGLRALSPVEQARRRQLEFTADASHELRTPLSVISAETSVALSSPRKATEYRATLVRIERESARLRKIVENLLWLARFDSAPPQPEDEPLDLATIAAECAERFRALGATQEFDVQVHTSGPRPSWISAPPDWIDRLAGVLMDNARRYAGPGGTVRMSVSQRGSRVSLTVEDSGPGVPPATRTRMFDRFHRSTEQGGSAGLGLAIADSIVRSTDGQWRLGDSELGGALFEVSWRRAGGRHQPEPGSASLDRSPGAAPPGPADPGVELDAASGSSQVTTM